MGIVRASTVLNFLRNYLISWKYIFQPKSTMEFFIKLLGIEVAQTDTRTGAEISWLELDKFSLITSTLIEYYESNDPKIKVIDISITNGVK